jgi:hypothetical protein
VDLVGAQLLDGLYAFDPEMRPKPMWSGRGVTEAAGSGRPSMPFTFQSGLDGTPGWICVGEPGRLW